jgi:hypothetical protein
MPAIEIAVASDSMEGQCRCWCSTCDICNRRYDAAPGVAASQHRPNPALADRLGAQADTDIFGHTRCCGIAGAPPLLRRKKAKAGALVCLPYFNLSEETSCRRGGGKIPSGLHSRSQPLRAKVACRSHARKLSVPAEPNCQPHRRDRRDAVPARRAGPHRRDLWRCRVSARPNAETDQSKLH